MTNKEKSFFNAAKAISALSTFHGTHGPHVGAIVVCGKTIISTGYNSSKTNPLQHKYNYYRHFSEYESSIASQHAEVSALAHLIGKEIDWPRTSLYVYREMHNGKPACSKPCAACSKLIHDLGIRQVYYINEFGQFVKEKIL